jgi:hypothetical protein
MLWLLAGLACEDRLGFDAVSLYPTQGWVDGCTNVRMGGHGFTDDFGATLGGNPISLIEGLPDPDATPLDVGFEKFGTTPPGDQGFADYVATQGDDKSTVTNAFYYQPCPAAPYVEAVDASVAGTISISGCGFDAASTDAYLVAKGGDPSTVTNPFPVTATCGTAVVSFDTGAGAPPGVYELYLSVDGGKTFIPDPSCIDKDTADTAVVCESPPVVTIKGGA